jgi:phage-related baseplate assembly protein
MSDVELVLRYFALSHYERMDMKFKDYLGDFMDMRNKEYVKDPQLEKVDRESFVRAIDNCWTVFGADAFRKDADSKKSAPLADAVMIALSDFSPDIVAKEAENIRAAIKTLLENNAAFQKAFGTGTNGKGAIRDRIVLAKEAVGAAVAH